MSGWEIKLAKAEAWAEVGPELLEALEMMSGHFHPCSTPIGAPGSPARLQWEDQRIAQDAALRAIEKAKGIK